MKFRFLRGITEVFGWQAFVLEADSLAEAKKKITDGCRCKFDYEEVEVVGLEGPDLCSLEQVADDYVPGTD